MIAVRLPGLSELVLSMRVLTLQVPNFIVAYLDFDFRPHNGEPSGRGFPDGMVVKQTMFRAPFLAPSQFRVSRVDPEQDCSVVVTAAEPLPCFFRKIERLNHITTASVPVLH